MICGGITYQRITWDGGVCMWYPVTRSGEHLAMTPHGLCRMGYRPDRQGD